MSQRISEVSSTLYPYHLPPPQKKKKILYLTPSPHFILIPHTGIFKPTDLAGYVSCPAKFGSRLETEDAPLVNG
jgi:hypothetical protein